MLLRFPLEHRHILLAVARAEMREDEPADIGLLRSRCSMQSRAVPVLICLFVKLRLECSFMNKHIRMLSQSGHGWKVNFCKFTNETRNAIEEAGAESGQRYLTVVNGPCAGGGYELALATDRIVMADDGNTAVSLPEVPLLAVLPGTGGLTRLVDKRRVRRDRADFFCTVSEGIKGKRALEWKLVDASVPPSKLADTVLVVGYTFAWDYPFQLRHQNTTTVLVSGKGLGPFSGVAGAASVAEELTKALRPYRTTK